MKNIIYLSILTLLLSACSKERLESLEEVSKYVSLKPYLDSKRPLEQTFIISGTDDLPIEGSQGTKIWLPKGILKTTEGEDVEFPYTVKLLELYKPKDMIYYQMSTVAKSNVLETDGEVKITAFKINEQGTEESLFLKTEETFLLEMPSDSVRKDMKVFYTLTNTNHPEWTSEQADAGANVEADLYFDELSTAYRANIGKLGWVNCGKAHQGFHTLKFTSEEDLTGVETFCFLEDYKSVIQAYGQVSHKIPDSTKVKVISMAIDKNQQLYYSLGSTTVAGSGNVSITLQPISEAELTTVLDSL